MKCVSQGWLGGEENSRLQVATTEPKSLYISDVVCHFYGTEYDIWADFGQDGNTEKKIGLIMNNF